MFSSLGDPDEAVVSFNGGAKKASRALSRALGADVRFSADGSFDFKEIRVSCGSAASCGSHRLPPRADTR